MKVFLMHANRDFDLEQPLPPNTEDMTQDLALNVVFKVMANNEDEFLFNVARVAVLSGAQNDISTIRYRQEVLADCIWNPEIVMQMYQIVVTAIENERKEFWGFSRYPAAVLSRSVGVLKMFLEKLKQLRQIADRHHADFKSAGFSTLFSMLRRELTDDYFMQIRSQLRELGFRDGVLVSAELGKANKGTNYVLRELRDRRRNWIVWMLYWLLWFWRRRPEPQTFYLHPRDETGAQALSALRARGINLVANAAAQSADHILSFFKQLRVELAFYLGCLNLRNCLIGKGEPVCFPDPKKIGSRKYAFDELYDVSLALSVDHKVVGNRANAEEKDLIVITGANQGGKSTFLRSAGLAQLMMQAGMFVGAKAFEAEICQSVFTHYKREEDAAMESGKFDEEISRMRDIADHLAPNSLVLFNESFAATNEREGSEVAREIIDALLEKRVKVFFVTHMYELAHGLTVDRKNDALFLRAERKEDGTRTFRLIEGEPLRTSYGEDLYNTIFGEDGQARERRNREVQMPLRS
jgi:DNA mismatch repair ATPase MutS